MRIVGLPVHLWSRKILEKIGDVCGGFLAIDEDTEMLTELCWARVLVRLGESEPPKVVEVMVGGLRFRIQLWWKFSPSPKVDSSLEQRRELKICRDDDGGAHAGERVCLGRSVTQLTTNAVGDVRDKAPVMSNQTQRLPPSQSSSHQSDQSSGRRRG